LLRVGFALPAALLRRRCALTAPFHPYLGVAAKAVCSLWHLPSDGLEPGLPDVIRHTALRSSDFPPVSRRATVRSSCQQNHYIGRQASDLRPQTVDLTGGAISPSARGKYLSAWKLLNLDPIEIYDTSRLSHPNDSPCPRNCRRPRNAFELGL
jgi:hypothetical protein